MNDTTEATRLVVNCGTAYNDKGNQWCIVTTDSITDTPWLQLYFNARFENQIAGTYDMTGKIMYCSDDFKNGYILSIDGQLSIKCLSYCDDSDGYNTYHFRADFLGQNFVYYVVDESFKVLAIKSEDSSKIKLYDHPEGLDDAVVSDTAIRKIIENGQVVIIHGNEKYTILGQKIQ